ncbi:hypothetical protein GQ53DRAFT_814637 [Thozetella sp. PMI_491]|nr:hypothetical protein GQ53DRAFT_814637 [Thozetella sp. PMI_491]
MQPLPCHDLGPVLSTIGNKFDLFPLLPSELRHEIWAFAWTASESTTSVGTVCALQSTDDPSEIPIIDPSLPPVYPLRNRALLATNKESRYIAHKLGTCRDFDPCIDILFIPSLAFEPFTFDFCENNPPAWVSTIRHLAIAPLVLKDGYESHLPHCLKYLNSLQKMSVVYPQSNGVVNSHADVKIPRQRGIALRLLSDNEVDELIVAADYTRMIILTAIIGFGTSVALDGGLKAGSFVPVLGNAPNSIGRANASPDTLAIPGPAGRLHANARAAV